MDCRFWNDRRREPVLLLLLTLAFAIGGAVAADVPTWRVATCSVVAIAGCWGGFWGYNGLLEVASQPQQNAPAGGGEIMLLFNCLLKAFLWWVVCGGAGCYLNRSGP